jgi:hypothetical protein
MASLLSNRIHVIKEKRFGFVLCPALLVVGDGIASDSGYTLSNWRLRTEVTTRTGFADGRSTEVTLSANKATSTIRDGIRSQTLDEFIDLSSNDRVCFGSRLDKGTVMALRD